MSLQGPSAYSAAAQGALSRMRPHHRAHAKAPLPLGSGAFGTNRNAAVYQAAAADRAVGPLIRKLFFNARISCINLPDERLDTVSVQLLINRALARTGARLIPLTIGKRLWRDLFDAGSEVMRKPFNYLLVAVAGSALAFGAFSSASASSLADPGVYYGSGNANPNSGFTVDTSTGAELGLGVHYRYTGPRVFPSSGNNYNVATGFYDASTHPCAVCAKWNIDFSVNLRPAGS